MLRARCHQVYITNTCAKHFTAFIAVGFSQWKKAMNIRFLLGFLRSSLPLASASGKRQ
jgi:hypothetical protein